MSRNSHCASVRPCRSRYASARLRYSGWLLIPTARLPFCAAAMVKQPFSAPDVQRGDRRPGQEPLSQCVAGTRPVVRPWPQQPFQESIDHIHVFAPRWRTQSLHAFWKTLRECLTTAARRAPNPGLRIAFEPAKTRGRQASGPPIALQAATPLPEPRFRPCRSSHRSPRRDEVAHLLVPGPLISLISTRLKITPGLVGSRCLRTSGSSDPTPRCSLHCGRLDVKRHFAVHHADQRIPCAPSASWPAGRPA